MPPGVAVLGPIDDATLRRFAGSNVIRSGFDLAQDPWHVDSVTCVGVVDDDVSHAAALDAALRGADIVVDVGGDRARRFTADLARVRIETWSPPMATTNASEWAPLLDVLACGGSVQDAARQCHISLRTAHRRLAAAREQLGVNSNAAAVATWSAGTTPAGTE
jgi:hypothetical protein